MDWAHHICSAHRQSATRNSAHEHLIQQFVVNDLSTGKLGDDWREGIYVLAEHHKVRDAEALAA